MLKDNMSDPAMALRWERSTFLFGADDDAGKPTKKPIMSFKEDMIPIFEKRCGDCHQPDGAGLVERGSTFRPMPG